MKRISTIVTFSVACMVAMAGLGLRPAAAQVTTDVYVVATGDIACDPSPKAGGTAPDPFYYAAYNSGNGTKDGCRQKAVGDAAIAAKPDQFWALGDNQYFDGTYAKYMEAYDKAFGPLKAITKPIPGNHEWKDIPAGFGYFTYFGAASHPETNGTYSFDAGDWHVIAINDNACDVSHSCGPGSAMAAWIASDMAANQKPCTAAMWHHPLWSLGEAHKGGYGWLVPVWNQLHDLDVDVVITGHDHNYVRTVPLGKTTVDPADASKVSPPTLDPNGMVEFVIGTGGVDNYAASAATAATFGPALAAYQVGKPSPGLFGAGGFHLKSDRYTFSYLPAANSAPFTDTGGRTCRRATNGTPQDVPGEPVAATTATAGQQEVTWSPTNTSVKMASNAGGSITPSDRATTSGDGTVTYAVTSAGKSGCSVDSAKGVIKYSDPGECEVTATAAATARYAEARQVVAFTITSGGPYKKQDMTAVQPAAGPRAGGNTVVLVGHGFADTTKVTLDGTSAKFQVISDARITVVAPPGKDVGPVSIRVTVGAPQGAIVAPDAYTYEAAAATGTPAPDTAVAVPVTATMTQTLLGNPDAARTLAPGLVLLSRADAARVKATVVKGRPGTSLRTTVSVRVKAGKPFSVLVGGQPAGQVVNVRAVVNGTSLSLGAARADGRGRVRVPALSVTRLGTFSLALVAPSPGKPDYVKVLVVK